MLEDKDIQLEIDFEEEAKAGIIGEMTNGIFSKENTKNYGRWMLYAVKVEITINELRGCLYWQSIFEFGLITITFILLLIQSRFVIFLHVIHFIRPLVCFKVISNLPRSHEIYEELPTLTETSAMHPIIYSHFQRGNRHITRYVIISVICMILDIVGCIISFTIIDSQSNADALYGFTAWVFLCFDTFLIFWYNTLRWAYPEVIWQNIRSVLKGGLSATQALLTNFMQSVRNRFTHS